MNHVAQQTWLVFSQVRGWVCSPAKHVTEDGDTQHPHLSASSSCPRHMSSWQNRLCFWTPHILQECELFGDHRQEVTLRKVTWCHSLNVRCQLPALSGMRSCLLQLYKQRSPKDYRGKKMIAIAVIHIWTIYGCTDESCLVLWFRQKQFEPKLSLPFSRVGD